MKTKLRRVWMRLQQRLSSEVHVQLSVPAERLGTAYGGWWLAPQGLSAASIIYSFGVGDDVSFDLALIQRWGATVHAFDPTPRSVQWVRAQTLPAQFQFHDYGLADFDGMAQFIPPANPRHVSYTLLAQTGQRSEAARGPVYRLATIMQRLGHAYIDLLKLDIEGAEYAVVEDLARSPSPLPIRQLLVEFHHRFEGLGWRKTEHALQQLRRLGFKLFRVSRRGDEFSFLQAVR
jgi:FkbM family methyltransferase